MPTSKWSSLTFWFMDQFPASEPTKLKCFRNQQRVNNLLNFFLSLDTSDTIISENRERKRKTEKKVHEMGKREKNSRDHIFRWFTCELYSLAGMPCFCILAKIKSPHMWRERERKEKLSVIESLVNYIEKVKMKFAHMNISPWHRPKCFDADPHQ